jgi:hypothetical protein
VAGSEGNSRGQRAAPVIAGKPEFICWREGFPVRKANTANSIEAMPDVGDLARTTNGRWITCPPTRCPSGHGLGAGQVLVGHTACAVTAGGTRRGPAAPPIRPCMGRH